MESSNAAYLFLNATYVITPTSSTDVMALNTLFGLLKGLVPMLF